MRYIIEDEDDIVAAIAQRFNTFGGGKSTTGNPISEALKDREPSFAAGVSVKQVVLLVQILEQARQKQIPIEI